MAADLLRAYGLLGSGVVSALWGDLSVPSKIAAEAA
jgi:hypothetical protein